MIRAEIFINELIETGFGLVSGVPCSYLTPLINAAIDSDKIRYISAANEGDAVAIACGAELGGKFGVVLMQNSGLGNAVNPITSLAATLRIPVLLVTTWRGQPQGPADEPQHEMMGQITPDLMTLMKVPWEKFPQEENEVAPAIARAVRHMGMNRAPYGLIMQKDSVHSHALMARSGRARNPPAGLSPSAAVAVEALGQDDALRTIQSSALKNDVLLATTGYCGRALYALGDYANQLYVVGSMGCASSLGLGLSVVQPQRRVIVIDGDGAVLMRMGALATIGFERPRNLVHIVLDNGLYESTGGQATVSPFLDFPALAHACGYPRVLRANSLTELQQCLLPDVADLTFVHVNTKPRQNTRLPRPQVTPAQVAQRLRTWLGVAPWTNIAECGC